MTGKGCPLCGAQHSTCGQPFTGNPVDVPREEVRTVGELRKYQVTVNGHTTVMKLTEDAAKDYPDATPVDAPSKARTVTNKARSPQQRKGGSGGGSGDSD